MYSATPQHWQHVNMGYFLLQNEARKLNQQEVVEEDKKRKLPANWEAKKARLEWELAEDQKKKVIVTVFLFLFHFKINCNCLVSQIILSCSCKSCHWPEHCKEQFPEKSKIKVAPAKGYISHNVSVGEPKIFHHKLWGCTPTLLLLNHLNLAFRNVLPEGRTIIEWNCWKSQLMKQSVGKGKRKRRTQTLDLQVGCSPLPVSCMRLIK